MVSAFWVWALSSLPVFITKARQKYKDFVALQKQKERCEKLMSCKESMEMKEDSHSTTNIQGDPNQSF